MIKVIPLFPNYKITTDGFGVRIMKNIDLICYVVNGLILIGSLIYLYYGIWG